MRNIILASIALSILAIITAIILSLPKTDNEPSADEPVQVEPPPFNELLPQGSRADKDVTVKVLIGDDITEMPMELYLIGVVASEMPASFELEALKAQAVAARTDTMFNMYVSRKERHPDADVCSDFSCCMAYSSDSLLREKWGGGYLENIIKIIGAVIETDGVYMSYEGSPILAVFHSSSAGKTEKSGNVWSADLPYLVCVDSPETSENVPNFISAVTVSQSDFIKTVLKTHPEAVFGDDPSTWITDISYTESGRISTLLLGGVTVKGPELRTMFQLRSTAASILVEKNDIIFTTTGYGHGVGMSQYGANIMAADGQKYKDILNTYYTGITLSDEIIPNSH